jgi:hypothetical protein
MRLRGIGRVAVRSRPRAVSDLDLPVSSIDLSVRRWRLRQGPGCTQGDVVGRVNEADAAVAAVAAVSGGVRRLHPPRRDSPVTTALFSVAALRPVFGAISALTGGGVVVVASSGGVGGGAVVSGRATAAGCCCQEI